MVPAHLLKAVAVGDLPAVKSLLESAGFRKHLVKYNFAAVAGERNRLAVLKYLLDFPECSNQYMGDDIFQAIRCTNIPMIEFLISYRKFRAFNKSTYAYAWWREISEVVDYGTPEIMQMFLNAGADPRDNNHSCILKAIKTGKPDIAIFLMDKYPLPDSIKCDAVKCACESGNLRILRYMHNLYDSSLFVSVQNFFAVACTGNLCSLKFIAKLFAPNISIINSPSYIWMNSKQLVKHLHIVAYLIEEMQLDKDCCGGILIKDAIIANNPKLLKYLIDAGSNVNSRYNLVTRYALDKPELMMLIINSGYKLTDEQHMVLKNYAKGENAEAYVDVLSLIKKKASPTLGDMISSDCATDTKEKDTSEVESKTIETKEEITNSIIVDVKPATDADALVTDAPPITESIVVDVVASDDAPNTEKTENEKSTVVATDAAASSYWCVIM